MGSFNIQCIASKMNITHYDEVVVFPLLKVHQDKHVTLKFNILEELERMPEKTKKYLQQYGGEMFRNPPENYTIHLSQVSAAQLYPCENWKVGLPIIAKYNDYGGFELEHLDQVASQVLVNYTRLHGVEMSKDNEQYARIHFKPSALSGQRDGHANDIATIINAQQEDLLFLASPNKMPGEQFDATHYSQATFTYMDKKVYDYILSEMADERADLHRKIEEHFEFIPQFLALQKIVYQGNGDEPDYMDNRTKMHALEKKVKLPEINSRYENSLQCFYPDQYFDFENYINKGNSWDERKKENYTQMLKAKADAKLINSYMSYVLHEAWAPVRYTDQEMSNQKRIDFNQAVNKIAKDKYDEVFGKPARKKKTR